MSTAERKPIVGPMQGTPEWYAERLTGIGASEAGAACGISEYKTPLDIYYRKRGLLPDQPDTQRMRMGRRHEQTIADEYEVRTGLKVERPVPMFRHWQHKFMLASPDGLVGPARGFEGKATNWRQAARLGAEGTDFIFDDWLMQCQQCMYVTGRAVWDLAAMVDGYEIRLYTIKRNDDLIAGIIAAEAELWERIQNGDPPEPNWTHPRTSELVKELNSLETGKAIELSEEAQFAWRVSEQIGKRIRRFKELQDALRARVLHEMGDAAIGNMAGARRVKRTVVERKEYTVQASSYVRLSEGAWQAGEQIADDGKTPRRASYLTERKALLALSNRCRWCNCELTLRTSTVDHVVPLAKGGSNRMENLALACRKCNEQRADSGLEPKFITGV